jgi:hypothetical protein
MRKAIFALILIIAMGCTEDRFQYDFSNGKASAKLNNSEWEGQGSGYENELVGGFDMYYEVFNKHGFLRQSLLFIKIPTQPGQYSLHNTSGQSMDTITGSSFVTSSDDGDVTEDIYQVFENPNESYVEVEIYDQSTRWLEGNFKATYYIKPGRPKTNPNNPDTLRFENGEFRVRIQ